MAISQVGAVYMTVVVMVMFWLCGVNEVIIRIYVAIVLHGVVQVILRGVVQVGVVPVGVVRVDHRAGSLQRCLSAKHSVQVHSADELNHLERHDRDSDPASDPYRPLSSSQQ